FTTSPSTRAPGGPLAGGSCRLRLLEVEHVALVFGVRAVLPGSAVCADDTVHGDDDREGGQTAGRADGAGRARAAGCRGDFAVAHRLAPLDRHDHLQGSEVETARQTPVEPH